MHPRAPKLLEDIRSAADFVKTVTQGVALEQFKLDRLLRQAVERNFEIIGEALRRLEKDDPGTAARIADYRRIIAFRNVLIHGYDVIDPAIVWSAITEDLAPLLADVQALSLCMGSPRLGRAAATHDHLFVHHPGPRSAGRAITLGQIRPYVQLDINKLTNLTKLTS